MTNNDACGTLQVTPAPLPDLILDAGGLGVFPLPPVTLGTAVLVNATIRNVGNATSGATVVRFHDGTPPAPQIGTDQSLGAITVDGTASASVAWSASPAGWHDPCAAVDPDDQVAELNEANHLVDLAPEVEDVPHADERDHGSRPRVGGT